MWVHTRMLEEYAILTGFGEKALYRDLDAWYLSRKLAIIVA